MHSFSYRKNELFCEQASIRELAARHGTPLYVYSQETLSRRFLDLDTALQPLDHRICYAVKANSNLAVLRVLARLGAGFDIVSEGELRRVIAAGGDPALCAFAGVGKTEREIEFALRRGIYCFNAESEAELARINRVAARLRKIAPVAVRVNPNVDARTHAKITTGTYENKFGIQFEQVEAVYARAAKLKNLRWRGVQTHIGSQLTDVEPFELAVKKLLPLVLKLKERHGLEFFSIGGGLGIIYDRALASGGAAWWESTEARGLLTPASYAARLKPLLAATGLKTLLEPGRFISGNAGILVTRVEYVKHTGAKTFVIVDGAMNDLIRPAMYDSWHQIIPVTRRSGACVSSDVVGPVCESSDYFCKNRSLPKVREGDYLAVLSAGAYGFAMASNYNTRPLAAEILVHGARAAVVRPRQPLEETWAAEKIPGWLT
ncbi:MAG TPA: diaminopimelate decarboxylase [Verrucomicrobiae bacterium]|jgi:diaminopimelate decarboxylase